MAGLFLPRIPDLRELFIDQVTRSGGTIQDVYDDSGQLYVRARLPQVKEVRRRDRVQNGVAMCASGPVIQVHPYTFREVCTNGAIMPRVIGRQTFERIPEPAGDREVDRLCFEVLEAISVSSSPETFAGSIDRLKGTLLVHSIETEHLVLLSHMLSESMQREMLPEILRRLEASGESSAFAVMNAITSLARDTLDPPTRWRLEELGGSIGARLAPPPRERPPAVAKSDVALV